MDLEARKITFVQEFLRLQNEEIITGLEMLLRKHKAELVEKDMKPMSIEQFNADIDRSLEDAKNGCIIEAKTLKDKIKKWR